jgi:cation transport ATPase
MLLLVMTMSGLVAGGLARLAGAGGVADVAWLAVAACGLADALWSAADSIRRGRLGVDVIALLALGGAVAVGELLAAAVISVMLTSGRALEAWAAYLGLRFVGGGAPRSPGEE